MNFPISLIKLVGKLYLIFLAYTSRLKLVNKEYIFPFQVKGQNVIYTLWHSRILFLVAYYYRYRFCLKKNRLSVIISRSRDGEYIAKIGEGIGLSSVRGSSSFTGAKAFSKLLSLGKDGYDLAVTPDGPRGPREVVKRGVIELGQKSGLTIIPVSYSSSWKKVFNTWDRFLLPFPFSKVVLIFGKPIHVKSEASDNEKRTLGLELASILKDITMQADEMVKV